MVDLADLHINKFCEVFMTGDYYNSQRAVERAIEGVKGIVQKSSGFNIEKIVFVVGNDVLNTDNIHKATTKGTAQDTDLHWYKAFKVGLDCYVSCVDYLLGFADVEVIHCPSNHDYITGTLLAETLAVYYRNHKNVTFQTGPKYRKYYQYHLNLIEFEHGDKGKPSTLPLAMANEVPQLWANTKFRYCCLHHVHHQDVIKFQSSKDYIGVNVTYMRSPSPADIWHFESDYVSLAAIEGQIYSKENGRVSHITHYF
ncbi:hypothetical protein D8Z79_025845 (plasmid) [Escherichia fergusonii]|nr:hypothetical protein D8Z79_025620 [Escherichia fergusonii]QCZ35067.1 hypothetical protein D8Z79_025845 [Escherichia fergusonii]